WSARFRRVTSTTSPRARRAPARTTCGVPCAAPDGPVVPCAAPDGPVVPCAAPDGPVCPLPHPRAPSVQQRWRTRGRRRPTLLRFNGGAPAFGLPGVAELAGGDAR